MKKKGYVVAIAVFAIFLANNLFAGENFKVLKFEKDASTATVEIPLMSHLKNTSAFPTDKWEFFLHIWKLEDKTNRIDIAQKFENNIRITGVSKNGNLIAEYLLPSEKGIYSTRLWGKIFNGWYPVVDGDPALYDGLQMSTGVKHPGIEQWFDTINGTHGNTFPGTMPDMF